MLERLGISSSSASLDTLQSMINGVLIETGKALRVANRKGPQTIGNTNVRLQVFIPSAIDKFHLALDDLEADIVRAKAVLARDLQDLRVHRASKGEEATTRPGISSTSSSGNRIPTEGDCLVSQAVPIPQGDHTRDDISEPEPTPVPVGVPVEVSKVEVQMDNDHQASTKFDSSTKSPEHKVLTEPEMGVSASLEDLKVEDELPQKINVTGLGIDLVANEVPADVEEHPSDTNLQYDDLFGTEEDGDTHNDVDFENMDFSTADNGAQDFDFGTAHGDDLALSNFDGGQTDDNNNDDLNAVLQEFGDFAAASGGSGFDGAATGDRDNFDGGTSEHKRPEDNTGLGANLNVGLGMESNESAFDDLLDGLVDFGDGADDGLDMGEMEHGEFDDAFFGISNDE